MQETPNTVDVVIIGGGMHGAGLAWFLATNPDFAGSVAVVERDPSYEFASTTHTNSCIRQQFSTELNIRISQFTTQYLKELDAPKWRRLESPKIGIREFGYLYLADNERFAEQLRRNQGLQNACDVPTEILSRAQIEQRFPFMRVDDLVLGSHNAKDEGYFDGSALFQWWRQAARRLGVHYLHDEVVGLETNAATNKVVSVQLASGASIACGVLVNAAGPRARQIASMAGIDLPVEPRKRYTYLFAAAKPLENGMPLTIDPSGVHLRADGDHYMAGCAPDPDPAVDYADFDADHGLWERRVWPIVASRVPCFDSVKLVTSWVGHYAYNPFDRNAIVGPHSRFTNFMFVNGFSGHGLQQAPAMACGLAELIVYGSYRTLDLSPLGFARISAGKPIIEQAVI